MQTLKTSMQQNTGGGVDIISGGFPCQPFSHAGKRKGTDDERHLWPEMLRIIREVQPTWVVGENVSGIVNWDGGLVFEQVQADLETEGYEVTSFILPACAVNAPHRRDRVWFVAYHEPAGVATKGVATYACSTGFQAPEQAAIEPKRRRSKGRAVAECFETSTWLNWPTQSPVCGGDDGISNRVDRLKALGNSMVPQVVYQIFKAIQAFEDLNLTTI